MSELKDIKAVDVKPYYYAIWCTVDGGAPFANRIVRRSWQKDYTEIVFMLETHNFYTARPDELMRVVEAEPYYYAELQAKVDAEDARRMSLPTKAVVPDCWLAL